MMIDTLTEAGLLPPYVEELRDKFEQRQIQNSRYSMRAFSRDLKLSAGAMSEIFSGKRRLTLKMAERIANRLNMTPSERSKFLVAVEATEQIGSLSDTMKGVGSDGGFQMLSDQIFAAMSEPHHFHILNLFYTNGFKQEPAWIAERLGLMESTVQEALARLLTLGLLERLENDELRPTNHRLTTSGEVTSAAVRHFHKRNLENAIDSLEKVPLEFRDITSVSFSIKSAQIPYLKKLIETFRRSMVEIAEREDGDEVYTLNIQLVPVTKIRKKS